MFKNSLMVTLEMIASPLTYLKVSESSTSSGVSLSNLASVVLSHSHILDPMLESLAAQLVLLKIATSSACNKLAHALGDHGVMSLEDLQKLEPVKAKTLMENVGMKELQIVKITEHFGSVPSTCAAEAPLEDGGGSTEVVECGNSLRPIVISFSRSRMMIGFSEDDVPSFMGLHDYEPVFDNALVDDRIYLKLFSEIGVNQHLHRVLLVLPSETSARQIQSVMRMFFEVLQVPELIVLPSDAATLYGSGSVTGVVLHVGNSRSVASAFIDGTNCCCPLVSSVVADAAVPSEQDLEMFFNPARFGQHCAGLHQLLHDAVAKQDASRRKELLGNINLDVPKLVFPKFQDRLAKELSRLLPADEISHLKMSVLDLAHCAPWFGGSIGASLSAICWISRTQHEADGCPFYEFFRPSSGTGKCMYVFSGGQVYEGEWKDGKKNGRGKLTFPDGEVHEGEWKDDKRNGRCKCTFMPDGQVYEGEWKDGKMNGRGKMTFPDGQVYEGEWKDDKKNGRGKHTWPCGQVYEGEWKDDAYNGQGSMNHPGCRCQCGTWEDGHFLGSLSCFEEGAAPSAAAACVAGGGATPPPIISTPVPCLPTSTKFSLEALQARGFQTAGCDASRLHEYLSDAEFHTVFGMSAADFKKMPGWKQADAKKKHRLF
jgi:hypothetical protein